MSQSPPSEKKSFIEWKEEKRAFFVFVFHVHASPQSSFCSLSHSLIFYVASKYKKIDKRENKLQYL